MKLFICQFCDRETTNPGGNAKHEISCKSNPNRKKSGGFAKGTRIGLGENQYTKAKKLGLEVPKGNGKTHGVPHTQETKEKLSKIAIANGLGGVRPSKRITYKGKTLGSTYELTLVKSLDENNIKWEICKKFNYIDPFGKKRTYTPDIYLVDYDIFLDPKNEFLINNINPSLGFRDVDKIKLVEEQNQIKVLILNKNQLDWETVNILISS